MNVKEIIKESLRESGHDGLVSGECACVIDDLAPCDEVCVLDCVPGKHTKGKVPEGYSFYLEADAAHEGRGEGEETCWTCGNRDVHGSGGWRCSKGKHPPEHTGHRYSCGEWEAQREAPGAEKETTCGSCKNFRCTTIGRAFHSADQKSCRDYDKK